MIGFITELTLRQVLGQRRTLLLLLLAALPVLVAVLFRLVGEEADTENFAGGLLSHFIGSLVLPLAALVVGTAVLGQEIEDGTTIYLLARPIARWKIVAAKIGAAWLVTAGLVGASAIASGLLVLTGREDQALTAAFFVAIVFGSLAYCALFVSLSIRFGRALIIGLAYVFVWEALVSQFVSGVRFLSIRAYTVGIADALADTPGSFLTTGLGPAASFVLLGTVVVLATWYAVRRLQRFELAERP